MLAKRAEPAVTIPRESSETFRQLVDDVQDVAIFMLDGAGRVSTWNSGAERIKGYRAEEIVGQHFSRFYPPEAVAEGKPARLLAIAARDGRVEDQGWRVRKDGARFWAEVIITARRDSEGAVIGFAKVTRDLTARKETQDALHRSEQTFQLLVESIQDCAIFMLDPDGRVASWNAAAERIQGYRAHEIMGEHFSTFYPPDDVAQGKPQWALEIAEREGRHEDEGWRVRKDGTRFWANTVISPMRDSQGGLIGYAKVTRDLTQRRRADRWPAQLLPPGTPGARAGPRRRHGAGGERGSRAASDSGLGRRRSGALTAASHQRGCGAAAPRARQSDRQRLQVQRQAGAPEGRDRR